MLLPVMHVVAPCNTVTELQELICTMRMQPLEGPLARMDSDADVKLIIAMDKGGCEANVVLRRDAQQEDILKAYVQGYMLLHSNAPMVCTCLRT